MNIYGKKTDINSNDAHKTTAADQKDLGTQTFKCWYKHVLLLIHKQLILYEKISNAIIKKCFIIITKDIVEKRARRLGLCLFIL